MPSAEVRAPHFLAISAVQLEGWASTHLDARKLLAVLLRKLVHSTAPELTLVEFPGYDDAERKGWDGRVEAGTATAWVPQGNSCWEFGVHAEPMTKANADYTKRTRSVPKQERANTTFIFVTPRRWAGAAAWARTMAAKGQWKAVRALDASSLEQWVELFPSVQMWLAEQLGLPAAGFVTLDHCWELWAHATTPVLTAKLFETTIVRCRQLFMEWLAKPPENVFVVVADSRPEALAFLASLFRDQPELQRRGDRAALFESKDALRAVTGNSDTVVPIVATDELERELAPLCGRFHCIVVRPRNAVAAAPDIALDLLGDEAFEKALAHMGINQEEARQLAANSGRSPTILRRRLAKVEALRTPLWATDPEAASLIPIVLAGVWNRTSQADQDILGKLGDTTHDAIEESFVRLMQFEDCPVWSLESFRGVVSKIDALFAVRTLITAKHLTAFLALAARVLAERDPAFDLPEADRWTAPIHGKVRDHSAPLRASVCETLVILAVHGKALFAARLGLDLEGLVGNLIERVLAPLTLDRLYSQEADLARYAEAAPGRFLELFEADLRRDAPVVLGLFKPARSGVFCRCPRTGFLWALEVLAWNPATFSRVSRILAQLALTKIEDNWANTPSSSLKAIFCSWMPQTAATLEERLTVLGSLQERFPSVAWSLAMAPLARHFGILVPTTRPRWRSDATGAGGAVTRKEQYEFERSALDTALAWPSHDEHTLADLIELVDVLLPADATRVWDLVDAWAGGGAGPEAKAGLRTSIRGWEGIARGKAAKAKEASRARAMAAYAALEPADLVARYRWLFEKEWIHDTRQDDPRQDPVRGYEEWHKRVAELRIAAVREIWGQRGAEGLATLVASYSATHAIGRSAAQVLPIADAEKLLQHLLANCDRPFETLRFAEGLLATLAADQRSVLIAACAAAGTDEATVALFCCAPFGETTWRQLDSCRVDLQARYWAEVPTTWGRLSPAELNEAVDRLLAAGRPVAAFHTAHMSWAEIETPRLKALLVGLTRTEAVEGGPLDAHDVAEALHSLDGRPDVTSEELAALEFTFIEALDRDERGFPNLEQQLANSPSLYVEALAAVYCRDDGGTDPADGTLSADQRPQVALRMYRLLEGLRRIPGTDASGAIDPIALIGWISEVRTLSPGRVATADLLMGQLLARGPPPADGVWPCGPICVAMEAVASSGLSDGFVTGALKSRGVHWRGEGGAQEKELAAGYREWAVRRRAKFPFVGAALEKIAARYDREGEQNDSEAMIRKRLRR